MAESPSHKFGQIIGNLIEEIVRPMLIEFCREQDFYLDYQENIRPARKGRKVTWQDSFGNSHDLDYVIEKNASAEKIGEPVAFIEVAWRRYTKHSRNKAQEIQGAILPLAQKYKWNKPFLGTVLAGIFTDGSITQLKSLGFHVLYFPYETIIEAFSDQSIDVSFDEHTPDAGFLKCIKTIEKSGPETTKKIKRNLVSTNKKNIDNFKKALYECLGRIIEKICIVPLYGNAAEFISIKEAMKFLNVYDQSQAGDDFRKYEISVKFSNGDRIDADFSDRKKACEFLEFLTK